MDFDQYRNNAGEINLVQAFEQAAAEAGLEGLGEGIKFLRHVEYFQATKSRQVAAVALAQAMLLV